MNLGYALIVVAAVTGSAGGGSGGSDRTAVAARVAQARADALARISRRHLAWGLLVPANELREVAATPTAAWVAMRYQHIHRSVPVYGSELIITIGAKREGETNALKLPLDVDVVPTIDAPAAEAVALKTVALRGELRAPRSDLVILPAKVLGGGVPATDTLAWKVEIAAMNDVDGAVARSVFVDAHSGSVIANQSDIRHATY